MKSAAAGDGEIEGEEEREALQSSDPCTHVDTCKIPACLCLNQTLLLFPPTPVFFFTEQEQLSIASFSPTLHKKKKHQRNPEAPRRAFQSEENVNGRAAALSKTSHLYPFSMF